MQYHDKQYLTLLSDVLVNGVKCDDRTGTGTINVFSRDMKFDLRDGTIPLLTTKKMHWNSVLHELLWFTSGDTNVQYLNDNGVRIWNEWSKDGTIGKGYGHQWRQLEVNPHIDFNHNPNPAIVYDKLDQLQIAIDTLKTNPSSRRIIVNSWNVADLNDMALPPCHYSFQFVTQRLSMEKRIELFTEANGVNALLDDLSNGSKKEWIHDTMDTHDTPRYELNLKLTMRSSDCFLGLGYNIAQYSILLHMVAQLTNMTVGDMAYSGADVHIYKNHITQCREQLKREPFPSPTLQLNKSITNIDDFTFDDFTLVDYESHSTIKGKVSV